MRDAAARAFEHQLNANHSDYAGPSHPCGCGQDARYAGRRAKTFTTVLGEVTLERAYYHCECCGRGFFPRDRAFGMVDSTLSPGAVRMTGVAAAEVSFAVASDLIGSLAGLVIDAKQVERTSEALGMEIAGDERCRVESEPASATTMYLGMDGTGVPVRAEERRGRPGKQADGSSKTREVKLAVVFTADKRDPESGHPMRDPGSVSYSAAIESAAMRDTDAEVSAFAGRVDREAWRRGFHGAQRQVVLGDGAKWIWAIADELFPRAIQIVDLFHAKERLWEVANAVYGHGTDLARGWADQQGKALEADRLDTVIAALRHLPQKKETVQAIGYFDHNRKRMRYATFRNQGLCVASGVVEAGCRTAIGVRLKRAGMHWTVAGANAIIALRCTKLSGRLEDFYEYRANAS